MARARQALARGRKRIVPREVPRCGNSLLGRPCWQDGAGGVGERLGSRYRLDLHNPCAHPPEDFSMTKLSRTPSPPPTLRTTGNGVPDTADTSSQTTDAPVIGASARADGPAATFDDAAPRQAFGPTRSELPASAAPTSGASVLQTRLHALTGAYAQAEPPAQGAAQQDVAGADNAPVVTGVRRDFDIKDYVGDYEIVSCTGEPAFHFRVDPENTSNINISLSDDGLPVVTLKSKTSTVPQNLFEFGSRSPYKYVPKEMHISRDGTSYELIDQSHYLGLRKERSRLSLDPETGQATIYTSHIEQLFIGLDPETKEQTVVLRRKDP